MESYLSDELDQDHPAARAPLPGDSDLHGRVRRPIRRGGLCVVAGPREDWRVALLSVTVSSVFYPDERSIKADTLAGVGICRAREFDSSRPRS
jgi:hypothetical protein